MGTKNQNTQGAETPREKARVDIASEIDRQTTFVITNGPDNMELKDAFQGANGPGKQRLLEFVLQPYLVDVDGLTAMPFKEKTYIIGVNVRQLGYVSANNQVFNVWAYIMEKPDNAGEFLHEGSEFQYGTLVYMCYDAAAAQGVVLKIQREAAENYGRSGLDLNLPVVASICPTSLRENDVMQLMTSGMMSLSFPIDYNREFNAPHYIRQYLDERFMWNGPPKSTSEKPESPEPAEETEKPEPEAEAGEPEAETEDADDGVTHIFPS